MDADIREKSSVVTDDEERAVVVAKARPDGFDGPNIEVVGRLVEHQQFRRAIGANGDGEAGPQHLAAAQVSRDQNQLGSRVLIDKCLAFRGRCFGECPAMLECYWGH